MNQLSTNPIRQDISLRKLVSEDLPFCAKLVEQAGWNQIDADWDRVMVLDPEGCYIVEKDGEMAGTIVFTRFDKVAWISMVLVDKLFRGKGIGQWMFGQVVDILNGKDIETIRLDATDLGVNLYKKFGFQEEYELVRMVCEDVKANTSKGELKQISTKDVAKVAELDSQITSTDRLRLIGHLAKENSAKIYVDLCDKDGVYGYVGIRSGRTGWQIGPCVAKDAESGIALLERSLESITGHKAIIDIPANNNALLEWAKNHNFIEQRQFIRMYAGPRIEDHPDKMFASFGPEKG